MVWKLVVGREAECHLSKKNMLCTFCYKNGESDLVSNCYPTFVFSFLLLLFTQLEDNNNDPQTWKALGMHSYERVVVVAEFITYIRHMSMVFTREATVKRKRKFVYYYTRSFKNI